MIKNHAEGFVDLDGNPVRSLRKGLTVKAPTILRSGGTPRAEIATPCCGVVYRVEAAYLTRFHHTSPMWVRCGHKIFGRGRTGKLGCGWNYRVTFAFTDGDSVEGQWLV